MVNCSSAGQQRFRCSSGAATLARALLPVQANPADLDMDDIIIACMVEDCKSIAWCRPADWDVDDMMKAQTLEGAQHSVNTEYVIKMLGLDICAETVVGNAMLRGISGGQKKRVTSGKAPASCFGVAKVWVLHAHERQRRVGTEEAGDLRYGWLC